MLNRVVKALYGGTQMLVPTFLYFFLLFLGCFLWPLPLFSSSHLFPPCAKKEIVPGGFASRVRFNSLYCLWSSSLGTREAQGHPTGWGFL